MKREKSKIFLSYAHEDIGLAKKIYEDLRRCNLDIWFDQVDLKAGQDWEFEIENAIENCSFFIALLSNNSINKKGYVQKESKKALDLLDYYPEGHIFLIPVRLEECRVLNKKLRSRHWVDLFPDTEYKNGIKNILKAINPESLVLRAQLKELSTAEVIEMLRGHNLYEINRNPEGQGFIHEYEEQVIRGDKVIVDSASGLMWQQGGSEDYIAFEKAPEYLNNLNRKGFAGFSDWRLPTLEEAMSLMEREKRYNNLYIDPVFDEMQRYIYTGDRCREGNRSGAWIVYFSDGDCNHVSLDISDSYIRAVRSG